MRDVLLKDLNLCKVTIAQLQDIIDKNALTQHCEEIVDREIVTQAHAIINDFSEKNAAFWREFNFLTNNPIDNDTHSEQRKIDQLAGLKQTLTARKLRLQQGAQASTKTTQETPEEKKKREELILELCSGEEEHKTAKPSRAPKSKKCK